MSSVTEKYLTFRGNLKAIAASGSTLLFVTRHPEGQPTGVYRLDADTFALAEDPLPGGGLALNIAETSLTIAGGDRRLYLGSVKGGKPTPFGPTFDAPPTALALLSDDRLAVLAGSQLTVLARKGGKLLQALDLPDSGSALAADPTGRWMVASTSKGTACVFDCEEKDAFLLGESAKLHEGAITALLFEPEELRFLSAGADGRLLSTHARGKLEPEDKGRGNNHADAVTALLWTTPPDRLISGGRDAAIKNWPRVGATKPATKDTGKVVGLAFVRVHTRTYLVAACEDDVLRFYPLDAALRLGDLTHRVYGADEWAKHELAEGEPRRREAALRQLAEWNDTPAVERVASQMSADADHGLRLVAAQLLSASNRPRAAKLLEKGLTHPDEVVRVAAFEGLRKHLGSTDLQPLNLALSSGRADVGRLAVQALEPLAAEDDQALARLVAALDSATAEIRQAALASLERVHEPKSPQADLIALGTKHADVRRLALVRLLQRGMLGDPRAASAVRRAAEDADGEVRRTAFLLSLHTRPALLAALRARDPELARQLTELEGIGQEMASTKAARPAARAKDAGAEPAEADFDPLLQATASRALDTCLRGARGLAVLGDERALGLLLQLSREQDAAARAEVARALSALDDPRGVGRLRSLLFDAEAAVRDAAFTALERIHGDEPLRAADAGLSASFEDVRRRGLQAVIAAARKKLPRDAGDPAWPLLIRALNDDAAGVRSEAFKAALNLPIAGGGVGTLRFVLQSVHADVRREVLTEAMARQNEPWAWGLLLEFLNDPDAKLREEAFEFATKKTKELGPLEAALKSRHADTRRRAVEALVKRHTKAAQALLATALADEDRDLRRQALDALIGDDVLDALRGALASPHDDVHARAAKALAGHGDPAALKPLLAIAASPEPAGAEQKSAWASLVETALDGLAELGDPAALPHVEPLLHSPHAGVRKAAGWALAWVALGLHPGALRQAMQHADPQVKYQAALGLALGGEASAAPLVFSGEGHKVLPAKERVAAALALGPAGEDQLVAMLDHPDERARTHALLLLMLLELKTSTAAPSRCLAALACREPRVRLRAARGLDSFRDPATFLQYVTRLFDDRGGIDATESETASKKPWDIPATVVDTVAELVAFGAPPTRARTARLLGRLFKEEQHAWDRAWAVHEKRYAAEVAALRESAKQRKPVPRGYGPEQLEELAFGAYVGLVREQGGSYSAKDRPAVEPHVARVRQTALSWVQELAKRSPERFSRPAQAVCVQALSDPNAAVRLQAFEQLQSLGTDATALGSEALEAGHTDLGVRGLQLLSGGSTDAKGQAVLEQAMLARTDELATEAAKLLIPQRGAVAVAAAALGAASDALRRQAILWLAAEYEKNADAPKELRDALTSRYAPVRELAALELATKKDPAAFDALVRLLAEAADEPRQRRYVEALQRLGDPRTPAALIDRLTNDPAKTASAGLLLAAAGSFRQPAIAHRLLSLMDANPAWRLPAGNALLTISGYDQPIEDPDDERPHDREWERKQFPRHDAVLAALLDKTLAVNAVERLRNVLTGALWARGKDVDAVLARLAGHPDERLRRAAVEAIGWRVRKRGMAPDALRQALSHRDPTTQFLAAEGLARAGRGEGLSVLLSAVDFLQDLELRRRAVRALGELGDARALDPLLKLANESGHALQDEAAEAIGHLGRSGSADEIFKLLERFARSGGLVAANALRGLRRLDTHAAWQLIRQQAEDQTFGWRETAVEQLAHNDDPATRDLLLRLLSGDDFEVREAALAAARRLFGPDSLEPDYALLRGEYLDDDDDDVKSMLRRVAERGEPGRVFELLAHCPTADVKDALAVSLLNRTPPPVREAEAALAGNDATAVRVAARVLGRVGSASKQATAALAKAVEAWQAKWDEQRQKQRQDAGPSWRRGDELTDALTPVLEALIWAAGRLGAAPADLLARAAAAHAGDLAYRPVRRAAVLALAEAKPTEPVASALATAAESSDDPQARALAADAVARNDPKRAAKAAEQVLPDRITFGRIVRNLPERDGASLARPLRAAASQPHYQGIALPHLIARGDVEALAAAAQERKLPAPARLGAIEALGKLATEPAEAVLRAVGASDKEDEELRKAAWRALRRSKRARTKSAATAATGVKP